MAQQTSFITRPNTKIDFAEVMETNNNIIKNTLVSGQDHIDADAGDFSDEFYSSLFDGRKKSGIIYIGKEDLASSLKIRANVKTKTADTCKQFYDADHNVG